VLEPGVVAEKVRNLPAGHGLNGASGEYEEQFGEDEKTQQDQFTDGPLGDDGRVVRFRGPAQALKRFDEGGGQW
jgi:hypothetical protein